MIFKSLESGFNNLACVIDKIPHPDKPKGSKMSKLTRIVVPLAVILAMAGSAFAQIPNPGFESWANGDPTGWSTGNGVYTFVTQTSSANSGSYAAQGGVVKVSSFNISADLRTATNSGVGFPVSQRYTTLSGFYKFTSVGGDMFFANYLAQNGSSGTGSGVFLGTSSQSVFTEFTILIYYPGPDVPDNGIISFSVTGAGGFPNVGSTFVVDDLSFGTSTGIADQPNGRPGEFRLNQNFPNPFNPSTSIIYSVPEQTHVTLTVFDPLGREVAVLVDQMQSAGRYKAVFDASSVASGVYFYRLAAGTRVQTNKMLLLR